MSDPRPIRTTSQVAAAVCCPFNHAHRLLVALEAKGIAEAHSGAWRATEDAWSRYSRPKVEERAA